MHALHEPEMVALTAKHGITINLRAPNNNWFGVSYTYHYLFKLILNASIQ